MNAGDQPGWLPELHGRRETIAASWHQAIAATGPMALEAGEVRQRLVELTEQAIEALVTEPLDQGKARAIGASLAQLQSLTPEALGRSQEVLAQQLVEDLPDDAVLDLQPRVVSLLAGVAVGFVQQGFKTALVEQEGIRTALTAALTEAQEGLRQSYDEVERCARERTAELVAVNRELLAEIAERKRSEEMLRESEETARVLLSAPTDIVGLIDARGIILDVNETAARALGKRREDLVGLCAWDLLPADLAKRRKAHSDRVLQSGNPVRFEDERDGIWFDNVFYPIRDAQGAVTRVGLWARDITERKGMEETIRRSLDETDRGRRLLLALSQAAQAVQRARTAEEVYETIGDGVAGLGYDAVIFTLADDGAHFDLTHMTYEPAKVRGAEKLLGLLERDLVFPLPVDSVFPDKELRSEAVFAESASTIMAQWLPAPLRPLAKHLAGLFGVEQMIHAALMAGDEFYGLLVIAGSGLIGADAQAVSAFASQAAIALENARLYQETRAWASELEQRVTARTEALSAANVRLEAEIAERMRVEEGLRCSQEELARQQRLLLALSQAAQAVQRARTPEEVYGTIGDEVAKAGYHVIVFTLGSEETGASSRPERPDLKLTGAAEGSTQAQGEATDDEPLSLIVSHVSADSAALRVVEKLSGVKAQGFRVPLAPGGLFQRIITENESVFHERTAERIASGVPRLGHGLVGRLVAMLGMERAIYAPLRVSGEAQGLLAVLGTDLTEADVPAVTAFANQAAIPLENARLLEDLSASSERLRELAHQVVSTQEEERLRLSHALHDEAGQALTALKISLELIGTDLPVESAALQQRVGDAAALTGDTMERIRVLAQDLRPPALDAVGLNHTLQGLCREFGSRTGLSIVYHGQEVPKLPDQGNIALYRCLQEALTNAAKHAGAHRISVALRYDAEKVRLSVEDDGQGFDTQALLFTPGGQKGIGLLGMQERLEAVGGRLEIDSQPGTGARLVAQIPLDEA